MDFLPLQLYNERMNNLFIEGPIQTGKSTLIRKYLGSHLQRCGGFTSQRLIDPSGRTKGFRLVSAAGSLTARAEEFESNAGSSKPFVSDAGIFKWFTEDGNVVTDQTVFDTTGVSLLKSSADRPLILLDEIGGSELLCDQFRKALDAVLSSTKPCLGVLKLADGAQRLQTQYETCGGLSVAEYNALLRHTITSSGGRLLYYDRQSSEACDVEREVSLFVNSVFD